MVTEEKIKELVKWLRENRHNDGWSEYDYSEGQKWWKILIINNGSNSVHSFIAKGDSTSKALGFVKEGDVHKAASWNAAARTARGSIFTPEKWGSTFGRYGAAYIR